MDNRYYPHQSSHCRLLVSKNFIVILEFTFYVFHRKLDETLQKNKLKIFSSSLECEIPSKQTSEESSSHLLLLLILL